MTPNVEEQAVTAVAADEPGPSAPPPKDVVYCGVCTFPPEYCEFSSSSSKCKAWLAEAHPSLFTSLYSEEALTQKMANLTAKQAEDLEKESAKKEKRAEAKAEKERKQLASSRIVLTRMARTKRKATTNIFGLHLFSPPLPTLKVVAKGLSSRLATGASVSKSTANPNIDEIVIQGDVAEDVREMIINRQKPFESLPKEEAGGLAASNIVVEEEKKKKPAAEDGAAAEGGDS